ncbi:hypothetical protein HMPREF9098_2271 [Kingella denitrificans ATCC 33394]|uniref:Uncharacterized protein n=1 Tax=Kingella denitrificans ATCC 33394 TaxID=888741 RepID=F0F2D6_9NEIS|nr:hypothetical protein HMPREF9098_2271 [Kingella denitrificans ATCC 33394]
MDKAPLSIHIFTVFLFFRLKKQPALLPSPMRETIFCRIGNSPK